MKRLSLFILLLSVCFANLLALPVRKNLNESWKFKQVRGYNWYPAVIPGRLLPGQAVIITVAGKLSIISR